MDAIIQNVVINGHTKIAFTFELTSFYDARETSKDEPKFFSKLLYRLTFSFWNEITLKLTTFCGNILSDAY